MFPYSERPGTKALEILPVVGPDELRRRTRDMIAISDRRHLDFAQRCTGKTRKVLLEQPTADESGMVGYTDNYLRVEVAGADASMANTIVDVRLGEVRWDDDGPIVKGKTEW